MDITMALKERRHQAGLLLAAVLACSQPLARAQEQSVRPEAQPVASLADSLKRADTQLHIFYIHGMAEEGPGHSDSEDLRKSICKYLKDCTTSEGVLDGNREYADKGSFAIDAQSPQLSYLGQPIWTSRQGGSLSEGWNASAPFVDHWKLARSGAHVPSIYVDEINWWPLVFAIKCRQIVANDATLAGPSKTYIDKCASFKPDPTTPGRFLSYPWIEPTDAQKLKALRARAAPINRGLKSYVLDWGFTDAVLAMGQMQPYLVEGIRQVVGKSIDVAADGSRGETVERAPNQEFVIVAHSLGSYLILAALDIPESAAAAATQAQKQRLEYVLSRISTVYFFANQLRLLDLANLANGTGENMTKRLELWGEFRNRYLASQSPSTPSHLARPHIVAWSDPSDLLTWNVPELSTVVVENRAVKNSTHWLWVLERPALAHANYATNKNVIRVMVAPPK
jgi:hypothetical protein